MYLFKKILAKILLLLLFCCPFVFTQVTYVKVNHENIAVPTNMFSIKVKASYYNEELFNKLKNPPYSLTYSVHVSTDSQSRSIDFNINGDLSDINILDHYSKFEKEEFVESLIIMQLTPGLYVAELTDAIYEIKGQVLQNGKPLVNHIINLFTADNYVYNSITDEDGNYNFYEIGFSAGSHIVSYKIENTIYEKTLLVEEKQYNGSFIPWFVAIINFNDGNIEQSITDVNEPTDLPTGYNLSQNYPNPFNPSTKIEYSLPEASMVRLSIYSSLGQEVASLVNEYKTAGKYIVDFNASNLPSGMYFYKLQSGNFNSVKKMMLLK
jgi:hypothetical protein